MKIKQLLLYIIVLITFTNLTYAQVGFISHITDINSTKDKLSYSITNFEDLKIDDTFTLEIYNNAKLIDDSCVKKLDFTQDTFFKKIICESDKLLQGEYTFVGLIMREDTQISKSITKLTAEKLSKSIINYEILENETIITIQVESKLETYQVEHYIPKEIIAELTLENQHDLIESELEFEILDSDPIIAWNIDESPKTIEYKIKKTSNSQDLSNLNVKINSSSQVYTYLSYVLYILIFLIIGVILKPIFKSKKIKQIK
jgi:hypothetical protein